MKAFLLALPLLVLPAISLRAEEAARLPTIIIGAPAAAESDHAPGAGTAANAQSQDKFERCVDVVIGHEKSFDCMNEKLKRQVDRVNPPVLNTPPIDARSQDLKVGVVNVPAVQQQYGKNFGVSAFPYRPPPPVYVAPLGSVGHH
jgi:hypothetical protein